MRDSFAQQDPYAPSIVQEMLAERNEWRQVHDIVKLTMKALCDVVRTQGSALREVERQIPLLATKADLEE